MHGVWGVSSACNALMARHLEPVGGRPGNAARGYPDGQLFLVTTVSQIKNAHLSPQGGLPHILSVNATIV